MIAVISCGKHQQKNEMITANIPAPQLSTNELSDKNLLTPQDTSFNDADLIRIGLLVFKHPEGKDASLQAWHGSELAIREINEKGGYKGKHFRLVVRSCDGPWGTGSKQTVNMVFNDQVSAIVGSVDGRNSHLIEQVIAKTHIPAVAAWATEPTLTEAFVPWLFRCVPDDRQQSRILIEDIYRQNKNAKVDLLSFGDYDSRNSADAFIKTITEKGLKIDERIVCDGTEKSIKNVTQRVLKNMPDAVVFFGFQSESGRIIVKLKNEIPQLSIYGNSWSIPDDSLMNLRGGEAIGMQLVSPDIVKSESGKKFYNNFEEAYGYPPNPIAAYAYDGTRVILAAMISAGPDRQKIRDAIAVIDFKDGATGTFRFDNHGNRVNLPGLMKYSSNL
jgi:branched-chain amino acid transport system substrate-binding protein